MSELARARWGRAAIAVALAVLSSRRSGFTATASIILSEWAVLTIAAIGLNLTLGYAGQVSLAQAAFVGIGAYCTALLTGRAGRSSPPWRSRSRCASSIGWLLGYPALRVQHHYLAFVTLAFSTLAFLVFRNEAWLTNGIDGIDNVARPVILGVSTRPPLAYYYFCLFALLVAALATLGSSARRGDAPSSRCAKIRCRAASLGVDTRRYTLMAFAHRLGARRPRRRALCAAGAVIEPPAVQR